jgi:TatD DNase family protein
MLVDSHCHLEMEAFEKDRKEVIERGLREGLRYMLTVGTEEAYFGKVIEILDRFPAVYGAIGIHPHNSNDFDVALVERITSYLEHPKIVAYGEIGLDFFKNYSSRESQVSAFRAQIALARETKLPVIIHSRNAKEETIEILTETLDSSVGGVIHCYSYDLPAAGRFLDMGLHISIPGTVTYRSAAHLVEVVKYVPMNRILAETDAPFLTPNPHRGRRNEPSFVRYTIESIAAAKNRGVEETAYSLYDNFVNLFLRAGGGQN